MKLLVSQKNDLFDLIEKSGFSPYQFEILETPLGLAKTWFTTELRYKNSDYFFRFDFSSDAGSFYDLIVFCPSSSTYLESTYEVLWNRHLLYVSNWLKYLNREISSPNKWNRLEKEIQSININFDNEEDKFSVHEYEDLQRKVEILKQGIPSIGLLPEQVQIFNGKLDYLVEAAKNMNKFDWKSLFIGTIISIVIQLQVTPDNAKTLWGLIKQVFHTYFLP